MPRRLALLLAVAGLTSAAAAAPAGADVQARLAGAEEVSTLISRAAHTWADRLQRPLGDFSDWLHNGSSGHGGYPESMLGLALLQAGARTGDVELMHHGLMGIRYVLDHPQTRPHPSTFEELAMSNAYNVAAGHLAGDAAFTAMRPDWEAWIENVKPVHLGTGHWPYVNKINVEALAWWNMLQTGLTSDVPGSVLSHRRWAARQILHMITTTVAARERDTAGRLFGAASMSMTDSEDEPMAYQQLAGGMFARLISQMGPQAPAAARRMIVETSRTTVAMTAPDGDLAYNGRSQEQVWTAPFAALIEYQAALYGAPPSWRTAAAQQLARLTDVYGGAGPQGLFIVPVLRFAPTTGTRAIDDYAGNSVYNGMALVAAEWALEARGDTQGTGPAPRVRSGTPINLEDATVAVLHKGTLWAAVRRTTGLFGRHHTDAGKDLRNDAGISTAKVLRDGRWTDLTPHRPITAEAQESVAPALLTGGQLAYFDGRDMRRTPDGSVTIRGDMRTIGGHVVRRNVVQTWSIDGDQIVMKIGVRRGDTVQVADYFDGQVTAFTTGAADASHVFSVGGLTVTGRNTDGPYVSAVDPQITRLSLTGTATRSTITTRWSAEGA